MTAVAAVLPRVLRGRATRLITRLAEHSTDLVLLVDARRRVRWANLAAQRVLGHETGTGVDGLRRWLEDPRLGDAVARSRRTGAAVEADVQEAPRGRTYRAVAVPMGEPRGSDWTLVVLSDDTAARRVTRTHQDLLANLSHDLRTPLAGLRLLAETLSGAARDDPAAMRTFSARIAVESDRLHTLVSGLLDLSRLEAGLDSADLSAIDLRDTVRSVVQRLQPQAERAGIALETEGASAMAVGDRARLELALSNVLDNAIRFTPGGGRVTVGLTDHDGEALLAVRDTGTGIPATDLPRIFERFYTGDRSRATRGSGLGLAIARHAIELQGGRIQADSQPGQGTTIRIWLRTPES